MIPLSPKKEFILENNLKKLVSHKKYLDYIGNIANFMKTPL